VARGRTADTLSGRSIAARRSREITVFHRKPSRPDHEELIELLLKADPTERQVVILEALQAGEIQGHEVDPVMRLVARLERVAGPRPSPKPTIVQHPAS
jgi:hypothetical protein